jgi:DNA-binding NtrC family response regulator
MTMNSKQIFFLEDDPDLNFAYRQFVESKNFQAISAESVDSMIRQEKEVLNCKIAILDIELGKNRANGLDALNWLRDRQFLGRVCFLTGHGLGHELVAKAAKICDVELFSKPISPQSLLQLVEDTPR